LLFIYQFTLHFYFLVVYFFTISFFSFFLPTIENARDRGLWRLNLDDQVVQPAVASLGYPSGEPCSFRCCSFLWLRRYVAFGLRLLARCPARPKADFPGSDRCGFAQLDRWRISDSHRVHRASDRPMAIHSACTERPLHRLGRRSAPTHTGF